jgi:hypothetical protein
MLRFKQFLLEDTGPTKLSYHDAFHQKLKNEFGKEYDIILSAAKRNGINDDNYEELSMLYSIRKAEHGGQGKEFGVLTPKAGLQPGDTPEKSLDRQAGQAAFSVHKRKQEFDASNKDPNKNFVTFFGEKWAPVGVSNDPNNLNKNWISNVQKLNDSFMSCEGLDCEPRVLTPTKPQQTSKPQTTPPQQPQSQPTQTNTEPSNPITAPGPKLPPLLNEPTKKY